MMIKDEQHPDRFPKLSSSFSSVQHQAFSKRRSKGASDPQLVSHRTAAAVRNAAGSCVSLVAACVRAIQAALPEAGCAFPSLS
jgi:hypothetical protein